MIINKLWEDHHANILKHLESGNDIENFLRWTSVQTTMHAGGCDKRQFDALANNDNWSTWKKALKEDSFGNPILSNYCPETSYASIFHAYSLSQIRPTGDVSDIKSVFEFGGGYCSMCKLIHRLGFKGKYTIFDLPALTQLQEIYLSKVGVKTDNITLTDKLPKLDVDLFIAEWSISESPKELREKVFENIKFKDCIISFHSAYGEYNNLSYFKAFIESMPDYDWEIKQIEHSPMNYYLTTRSKNV